MSALHFLSCLLSLQKWHQTSARCHCGNTTGMGTLVQRQSRRERDMASREIEQNEKRQEERWRDDQIKHAGHFIAVRKGLIYTPPLSAHSQKANSAIRQHRLCQDKSRSDCGELLLQTEVSYCWPRVYAITHQGGPGLSLLQQLATALINTLLFTH